MLPRVKIKFINGAIGAFQALEDGTSGLVCTAETVVAETGVTPGFSLGTPILLQKLADLETYGITKEAAYAETTPKNTLLYQTVADFYNEAPNGTKLWIIGVADTVKMSEMLDKNEDYAKALLDAAEGAINILFVATAQATGTNENGLDADVAIAITKGQDLTETYTEDNFAPSIVIIPGFAYNNQATSLRNLSTDSNNRVAVMIGGQDSSGNSIGLLAGRLAAIPVHQSIARVKTGKINTQTNLMFIGLQKANNDIATILHDKAYICPRIFTGKAGYYWSDDKLATMATDDYSFIARRRTIDKAYRIAYATLVEELSDNIAVTADGKIANAVVKAIQTKVERAIWQDMGNAGNLGTDPDNLDDKGVECFIDANQNIVASGQLNISLSIRPYGYSKYINLDLGFQTTTTN